MSAGIYPKTYSAILVLFTLLFTACAAFAAQGKSEASKTSIEVFVIQKHDRAYIDNAEIFFEMGNKKIKAAPIDKGVYIIKYIILDNPVVNRGTIRIMYRDVPIYAKKILLFNIPQNKFKIEIRGVMSIPKPPRLDTMYSFTNEKFEKFSGEKDVYSSVYINGEIAEKGTYSTRWKTYRKLSPGLNVLVFTSRNIWGGESKPLIFYISYFLNTEGKMKFFEGPGNVRSKRSKTASTVSWDDLDDGEVVGYNIYRSNTSKNNYKKINKDAVKRSPYTDSDSGSAEWYYVVTAVLPEYETPFSGEVSSVPDSLPGTDIPDKIKGDLTLSADRSPYLVSSDVEIAEGSALIIEPGVELRFKKGSTSISGKILAEGDDDKPIFFTSDQKNAKAGNWRGIDAKDGSVIKNSNIEYAGSGGSDAVSVRDNSVITKSTVGNNLSSGIGIRSNSNTAKVLVSGNKVSDNGNDGIYAGDVAAGTYIDISDNEISKNKGRGISTSANSSMIGNMISENGFGNITEIKDGEISCDVTWDKGKYAVNISIDADDAASLTLKPGVTIKSEPRVQISGKISARGTKDEKIIFTSESEKIGEFWGGLVLENGSDLENCTVSYVLGPKDGIYRKGEDINLVEVKSYFTEQRTNVFNLEELTTSAIGEK
ncbi:MAG: right-handed parallel beta-helix repeat-containing protein, partial [Candidatus Omnitrophota bacterium]